MADDLGLSTIALTDHDTIAGVEGALESADDTALQVIPGIELSTLAGFGEAHILGYFIDHKSPHLIEVLAILRDSRLERAEKIMSALAQLGVDISWDELHRAPKGNGVVGRPHIAQALVDRGYASSIDQAFERYLSRGAPAFVERYKLSPAEAIQLIRSAGGVAVLAHPLNLTGLIPELAGYGLAGLETFYRGYSPGEVSGLLSIARRYDLVPTGGTDFHGRFEPAQVSLGSIFIPPGTIERLTSRINGRAN